MGILFTFKSTLGLDKINGQMLAADAKKIVEQFNNETTDEAKIEYCGTIFPSFYLFLDVTTPPAPIIKHLIDISLRTDFLTENYSSLNVKSGLAVTKNNAHNAYTKNQKVLDQLAIKTTPSDEKEISEYICPLSGQYIDTPILLPQTTQRVDLRALSQWFKTSKMNPFNKQPLPWMEEEEMQIAIDYKFQKELEDYLFKLTSKDTVTQINELITLDDIHIPGYMSYESNSYGHDQQKYQTPYSVRIFRTGFTSSICNSLTGEIRPQHHENLAYKKLNYPHPSKTEEALRDLIFAIRTENPDQFNEILRCYPSKARKYLLEFASRYSEKYRQKNTSSSEPLPQPHALGWEEFTETPHRCTRESIEFLPYQGPKR